MAILNIGSINWDRVYHVPHFPAPGETLAATGVEIGLGGKGLNHSVAVHRAGGEVLHLGAVGESDKPIRERIEALGLGTEAIVGLSDRETGSAQILVDESGENTIVLDPGANRAIPLNAMRKAIDGLDPGAGWLLMQNETNGLSDAISHAKERGVHVALAAAPFVAGDVVPVLAQVDLLAVNAIEFSQLCEEIGGAEKLPEGLWLFVSKGAEGAELRGPEGVVHAKAFEVDAVDTTGAGDTAFGALLARLDAGDTRESALAYAMAAAAIQVTRPGAAEAIPTEAEVRTFMEGNG